MLKMAKLAKFISILCSSSSLVMITAFLSFRVVTVYLADKVNENQDRLSLYPGYFPFDVRPAPILITINFAQVIAAYSATICYTTVDAFIAMLITHMCGQFAILKKKLLRLMSDDRESRSVDEFQRELTLIVTKHDHLNGWIVYLIIIVIFQRTVYFLIYLLIVNIVCDNFNILGTYWSVLFNEFNWLQFNF